MGEENRGEERQIVEAGNIGKLMHVGCVFASEAIPASSKEVILRSYRQLLVQYGEIVWPIAS